MLLQIGILLFQVACLFTLLLIGWYVYLRTSHFHRAANRIPGPRALPLLGNVLDLVGEKDVFVKVVHTKWVEEFGEIFRMFVGNNCYVIISSPELVEPLLKSQKYIEKGLSYDLLVPWVGRGLLTNYGDSWKIRRRLITPAFHFDILKNFADVFNEQSRTLVNVLLDQSRNNGVEKPTEISSFVTRCTLDIICEAAMGTKVNAQLQDTIYSKSIHRVGEVLIELFLKPWLLNPFLLRVSSLGREQRRVIDTLNGFSDKVINDRREYIEKSGQNLPNEDGSTNKKKRLALLDLLLTASEDGQKLTHEEIRNEINTFLFAGHETTSVLVSWFLYLMATNPEHQEKVREELFEVLGDSDSDCNQDDLANLKYLDCCVKETLRLYPSVPEFERIAIDDVKLGSYLIPAGCSVLVSVFGMHRNAKYFEDPLVFKPGRFHPDEGDKRHPFCYVPFSAGPRNCIGQRFAMIEARVILAHVMRNLEFEVSPDCVPPNPANLLSLRSLNGINLIVKPFKK